MRRPAWLVLHGFTLNGATMRRQMGVLARALAEHVQLIFLDAPHGCPEQPVRRLHGVWGLPPQLPPYLCWWNASADGSIYEGWDSTRELVASEIERHGASGILGFSQGAIVAAAAVALSERGELPPLDAAVLIAGRVPRATVFAEAFAWPLDTRSLHVWGERDTLTGSYAPALADCFSPETRQICTWPGAHAIPKHGRVAGVIAEFVRRSTQREGEPTPGSRA
jgi:predicted esterase